MQVKMENRKTEQIIDLDAGQADRKYPPLKLVLSAMVAIYLAVFLVAVVYTI